jgi:ketosteroid isomerase-like protein
MRRSTVGADDVEVVRRLYAAVNDRDMAAAAACCTPDARWTLPGRSPIAGTHVGWDQIYDRFLAKLAPLSGGTFRAELLDVTLGERFVVAVQHATAALDGRILDVTGCQLMEISGGRISRVRGHYSDQEALDSFWRAP